MSSKTFVPTATVREWARENLSTIDPAGHLSVLGKNGDGTNVRGRLHPTVREAFNKANRSKAYAEKAAEDRTITFEVAVKNRAGAWRKKSVTILTSEARVLLGHEANEAGQMKRGRMSKSALAAAYVAREGLPVREDA